MAANFKISEIFNDSNRVLQKSFSIPFDVKINEKYGFGSLKIRPLKKGMSLCIYDLNYKRDTTINTKGWNPFDKIWIFVCLTGKARFTMKNREFKILPGYSEIFTGGFDIPLKEDMKKDSPQSIVSLIFEPQAFTEITGKSPEEIYKMNLKIPPEKRIKTPKGMKLAANQLFFSNQPNVALKLFREAKALEMISYKLGQLENFYQKTSDVKKTFVEKIHYAAEILENNLVDPPGIFDISDQTGLNHNKLINGFKDVFDLTPFEYLSRTRLHRAAELIKKGDHKITEAAFSVGYSNLSHFAKIFKKEFGVNPSQYRKQL